MQIQLFIDNTPSARPRAIIKHNDLHMDWSLSYIDKDTFNKCEYDVFEFLNSYWSTLPEQHQEAIYNAYQDIRSAFDMFSTTSGQVLLTIKKAVTTLLELNQLTDIHNWVKFNSSVYIPSDLKLVYEYSVDKAGTPEQTYLREDYIGAVALTILSKAMFPVWAEYINRSKQETSTTHKEYFAFQLITDSYVFESVPVEKLISYIRKALETEDIRTRIIMDGLSTENFPYWLLAVIMVRRLTIADLRFTHPNNTLITYIYKYLKQKLATEDNATSVKIKNFADDADGDNLSRAEGYKIPAAMSIGDEVILNSAFNDVVKTARFLEPDIPEDLVLTSVNTAIAHLSNAEIKKVQITLAQWTAITVKDKANRSIITPRGVLYLPKISLIKLLGITQAVLYYRGFKLFAGLVTARSDNIDSNYSTGADSRARFTKENVEKLNEIYRFTKKTSRTKNSKSINVAITAIDEVTEMLNEDVYYLTVHDSMVASCNSERNTRELIIPSNIKNMLAELLIFNSKKEVQ